MPVIPQRRYPLEPLLQLRGFTSTLSATGYSCARFGATYGIDNGRVQRAMREGLTWHSADEWAVRCGYLPYEVWPDWIDDSIAWAENISKATLDHMRRREEIMALRDQKRPAATAACEAGRTVKVAM